jgi:photosystem II stability/assembly factor-like uncharacterized protein
MTKDGGAHWAAIDAKTSVTLRGVAVAEGAGVIVVVGDAGTLVRSPDRGSSWTTGFVPGAGDLRGVATDPGAHLVLAVDAAGIVWSSGDGGSSFVREGAADAPLDAVALSDDGSRALAVGAGGTVIARDLASGAPAWLPVPSGTTSDLHAVLITDGATRDYVAGEAGALLTTTDRGAHWARVQLVSSAIYGLEDL